MSLHISRLVNTPIDSNCYIIYDKLKSNKCIVVDPGSSDNMKLISLLETLCLTPDYLILTHEHYDHCWGVNNMRVLFPDIKLVCSKPCSDAIKNDRLNYSHYFCSPGFGISEPEIIIYEKKWRLFWNGSYLHFTQAKGHSLAGIFIQIENTIFTGDTLIKGLRTETRFKTGSRSDLKESIDYLVSQKGNGFILYPGHGNAFQLDGYDLNIALGE